jgi:predicted nucleotidyltransferase
MLVFTYAVETLRADIGPVTSYTDTFVSQSTTGDRMPKGELNNDDQIIVVYNIFRS